MIQMKSNKVLGGISLGCVCLVIALQAKNMRLQSELEDSKEKPATVITEVKPATVKPSVDLTNLKEELADKDRLIDELREKLAAATSKPADEAPKEQRQARRGNWMEDLREKDPERYEKIKTAMDQMGTNIWDTVEVQEAFFTEMDTTNMTDEQYANHEKLIEELQSMKSIASQLEANPSDRNAYRKLFGKMMSMDGLMQSERSYALDQYGRELGFQDEKEFSTYVGDVILLTSPRTYMPKMGGMGRR